MQFSTIEEGYTWAKDTPSNIFQHIPVLEELALQCTSVGELGLNTMTSTWGFLKGLRFNKKKKKHHFAMDINGPPPGYNQLVEICKRNKITNEFVHGNSLRSDIPKVDLLFIDTCHHYAQLIRELEKHHKHVKKYIVLHNTEIDSEYGETVRMCYYFDMDVLSKEIDCPMEDLCKGMGYAIREFLEKHPEWQIEKHLTNNNGLTILSKKEKEMEKEDS